MTLRLKRESPIKTSPKVLSGLELAPTPEDLEALAQHVAVTPAL